MIWLFVLVAGVVWRLGGGALTTLTGFSLGTDFARFVRASLGAIFVLKFGLLGLAVVPALFLGVVIGGWGPFQGMGLVLSVPPEASWQNRLPALLRLKPGTFGFDFIGMTESGLLCMLPVAFAVSCIELRPEWLLLLTGLLFSPCYALARIVPVSIPRFATGQEWGEVFTGAVVGVAFVATILN